jgi:hypothetical protein
MEVFDQQTRNIKGDTIRNADATYSVTRIVRSSASLFNHSTRLHNAASNIYSFSRDSIYLNKALLWIVAAVELGRSEASLDTHARILYALNRQTDAIQLAEKAIEQGKKGRMLNTRVEETLQKMKKGELL